jgi:hypothetical protein
MPLKKYMLWSGCRPAWFPAVFRQSRQSVFSPMRRGEKYFFAYFLNCEKATANKTIATYNLEKIQSDISNTLSNSRKNSI